MSELIKSALQAYLELAQHMHDEVCQSYNGDVMVAKQAIAALSRQEAEPVMIYHGRCMLDCGDGGHHNVELLRIIADGTQLYARPSKPAALPQPVELDWPRWAAGRPYLPKMTEEVLDMVPPDESVVLIENGKWPQAAVDFVAVIPVFPPAEAQPVASVPQEKVPKCSCMTCKIADEDAASAPQDVEEFIAENGLQFVDTMGGFAVNLNRSKTCKYPSPEYASVDHLRAWMAGHARVPRKLLAVISREAILDAEVQEEVDSLLTASKEPHNE